MTNWSKRLWFDIETYSSVDLQTCGVYKYAQSEDFQVLLFAYAYDDDPVKVLDLTRQDLPSEIVQDIQDPSVMKLAHNASFERICMSYYIHKKMLDWHITNGVWNPPLFAFLKPRGWYCTMVHSAMCGLPLSLKQVGDALDLAEDEKKLATGKALIKYFCQPCKPTQVNGGRTRNLPKHAPEKWDQFMTYCGQDVETERIIEHRLDEYYPMPDIELERYWVDQRINDDGVLVDMDMVHIILDYGGKHSQLVREEAERISGINIKSVQQLKAWVKERTGIEPESMRKESIEELIPTISQPDVKKVLELRQEAGKTSVKKYDVFKRAVTNDSRIHGCFQFYGSRTGRFSGRLVQPQNLPRNSFNNFDAARKLVKAEDWEMLEFCYDSINDVFATLIRTAFIPPEGKAFAIADYSAIEARVIAWLADEKWRMKAFHDGKDIYCESASMMFKVPVEKHGVNGELRKQGKVAELALGYEGGVGAMIRFKADKMGMTRSQMADIVAKWRKASPKICRLWQTMEDMVDDALKGKKARGPKGMEAQMVNGALEFTLPSGRRICYQNPRYETVKGERSFYYDGLNQTTRKYAKTNSYGGKFTENVVQAIARDCLVTLIDRIQAYYPEARIVMHVHDEIIVEVPADKKEEWLEKVLEVMAQPLDWAPGLELKGAGFTADYYQKD